MLVIMSYFSFEESFVNRLIGYNAECTVEENIVNLRSQNEWEGKLLALIFE